MPQDLTFEYHTQFMQLVSSNGNLSDGLSQRVGAILIGAQEGIEDAFEKPSSSFGCTKDAY